jgi:hypothetical protein
MKTRTVVLAVLLVIPLALSACGGGGSKASSSTDSSQSSSSSKDNTDNTDNTDQSSSTSGNNKLTQFCSAFSGAGGATVPSNKELKSELSELKSTAPDSVKAQVAVLVKQFEALLKLGELTDVASSDPAALDSIFSDPGLTSALSDLSDFQSSNC